MAAKVYWSAFPGKLAYSIEQTVGPEDCVNETLDVMLVQFFLSNLSGGFFSPLGNRISVTGTYDATTHYWSLVFMDVNTNFKDKNKVAFNKISPLVSLTPNFLTNDSSLDMMELLNRNYSKLNEIEFKNLSVVKSVPGVLRKRLETYGYTL